MDPVVSELLRQGILGVIIAGFVLGWIVPRPAMDAAVKREAVKDAIIAELQGTISRYAEAYAKQAERWGDEKARRP
jgi:hypothetical protein